MKLSILASCSIPDSERQTPSVISPSLSRLPFARDSNFSRRREDPSQIQKDPLLTLALSTPSFLDCTIIDVATTYPLYRIETWGTNTTVLRRESVESTLCASSIKWPNVLPLKRTKARLDLVLLLMRDGSWRSGGSLLKLGSKENSRTFRLPNYHNALKWKLIDGRYWCTTPSCRGAVATLDPNKAASPPKLIIYEDIHDKNKPHRQDYSGVSTLLLDYLVVTALLLVTDLQEWRLVPRPDDIRRSGKVVRSAKSDSRMKKGNLVSPTRSEAYSPAASTMRSGPSSPISYQTNHYSHNLTSQLSFFDTALQNGNKGKGKDPMRKVRFPGSLSTPHSPDSPNSSILGPAFHSEPQSRVTSVAHRRRSRSVPGAIPRFIAGLPPTVLESKSEENLDQTVTVPPVDLDALKVTETELEPKSSRVRDQRSMGNLRKIPRPLPIPPVTYGVDKLPSSSNYTPSIPSLTYSPRSNTSRQLPVSPIITSVLGGVYPRWMGDQSTSVIRYRQAPSLASTFDDEDQRRIQKESQEDIAEWLNSLTGDPPNEIGPDLLPDLFGVPPPAYNSLHNSSEDRRRAIVGPT